MTDQIERDEEKPEQDLSLEELAAEIPGKEGFLAAQRYVWNNSAEKKGTYGDWVAGQEVFRWIEDDPEVNFSISAKLICGKSSSRMSDKFF